jgi:PAS domain S-box-containing protein
MPGAIFVSDAAARAERRLSYVSPDAERLMGISIDRLTAPGAFELLLELLDDDARARHIAALEAAFQRGEQFEVTFPFRRPDGRMRWILQRGIQMPGSDVRVGFWLDVTDQRDEQIRYQDVLASMPAVVAVIDVAEERVLFVNQRAEELTGEPVGYWTRPGGLAEFRERAFAEDPIPDWDVWPENGVRSAQFRWRRPDGGIRWLRGVSTRLTGTDNVAQALLWDITAEVEAAQGYDEQRRLYRTLVEQLPVATFVTDPGGVMTYVSPQIEQILGVGSEAIVGSTPAERREYIHQDDRPAMGAAMEEFYGARRDGYDLEARMLRRTDGSVRHVQTIARELVDDSGTRIGLQGVMIDATDRWEAEHRRHEALEALVMAAEAEQARISGELHDDTVQVMTAVLLELRRLPRDDHSERLEQLVAGALERMRRLMFELRPQILKREGLAAAVVQLAAEGPWRSSTVAIEAPRLSETTEALAYRTIRELIVNARKHSEATTLSVTGSLDDGRLALVVADDGVGFDPGRTRDGDPFGLHIGLDTSAERVRVAGGDLVIESTPGAGTRASLNLPAEQAGV